MLWRCLLRTSEFSQRRNGVIENLRKIHFSKEIVRCIIKAAKEVRVDSALRMIKDGELSLEKIALYSGLSVDEVKELATPVIA